MPDQKISQLPAGGAAQATDEIPVARTGTNVKLTGANIAAAATSVGTLTSTLSLSQSLTSAQAQSVIDAVATWNTTGTPTAIKLNVTDTASNAASLLMDLQTGATTRFSVNKGGVITASSINLTAETTGLSLNGQKSLYRVGNTVWVGTGPYFAVQPDYVNFGTSAGAPRLTHDADDTLAQRRTTNPQTFRVYNTFTDASNYERARLAWSSNVLIIGTEKAGTGTARALEFQADGVTRMSISAANGLIDLPSTGSGSGNQQLSVARIVYAGEGYRVGNTARIDFSNGTDYNRSITTNSGGGLAITDSGTGGQSLEFREQTAPAAPATNRVRIYAEDNGSGKTRLMALFATGAAQQIAIEP